MTTLDRRTPTVLENVQFVETPRPASPPPMPPPSTFHVRASAFVLLGAMGAAYLGVKTHPEFLEVSASAVFAAIVLFLTCLLRYSNPGRQR